MANMKLASLYKRMHRYDEAELLLKDAVDYLSKKLGDYHFNTLAAIDVLADLYMMTDRPAEAARLARKTLVKIPSDAPDSALGRAILSEILRKAERKRAAED